MPDWSVTKTQTKKQSSRSSRIAGGGGVGRKPANLPRPKYCYEIQRSNGRTVSGIAGKASEEGLGSKGAVVPMTMMMINPRG